MMMNKINVVGTSASGKSTFSKKLAEKLGLDYIELDNLFWLDDWQEASDLEFFTKIKQHIQAAERGYVIDGNYTRSVNIKWDNIDTVIWLDLPFCTNLYQAVARAICRVVTKQKLWQNSNNQESVRQIFSKDSIIWWMIKTHHKNRKKYQEMMLNPKYSHIRFIHLKSRNDYSEFLASL